MHKKKSSSSLYEFIYLSSFFISNKLAHTPPMQLFLYHRKVLSFLLIRSFYLVFFIPFVNWNSSFCLQFFFHSFTHSLTLEISFLNRWYNYLLTELLLLLSTFVDHQISSMIINSLWKKRRKMKFVWNFLFISIAVCHFSFFVENMNIIMNWSSVQLFLFIIIIIVIIIIIMMMMIITQSEQNNNDIMMMMDMHLVKWMQWNLFFSLFWKFRCCCCCWW